MKQIVLLILVAIFSSLTAIAQKDSIDGFIAEQMNQQGIIGLSLGIVKNGKIIKAKGYGKSNVELNISASENTVYKVASISKQFIGVGILKLVQEGKLKVSDPISKYIKNTPDRWNSITIRHLLNHTSGLPVEPPDFDGMKEQADSIYVRKAFGDSTNFPTVSKFEYSNFGYFILADIIRIASGLSFTDYMQKEIFEKCQLSTTRTTSLEAIVSDRATGYTKNQDNKLINATNYVAMRPSGAFLSTINDLLKWELIMQNNDMLTKDSWEQIRKDTIKTALTMDNEPIYYGYGWMSNRIVGKQLLHHGGSLPGFTSVFFRLVDDRSAVIILTNSDNVDAYRIAFGIIDLLSDDNNQK